MAVMREKPFLSIKLSQVLWFCDECLIIKNMKLKLKQSNSNSKHFALPYLKNAQNHRYTPRSIVNKGSRQKIPEINHSPEQIKQLYSKIKSLQRPPLKQKIKSIQQRKKYQQTPVHQRHQSFVQRDLEDANITSNLKKQIEKNLVFIKKEKENRKKLLQQKKRYKTPRSVTLENEPCVQSRKSQKCATQENEVFSKINEIINKSHSKSTFLHDVQPNNISFSSYLSKQQSKISIDQTLIKKKISRRKLKTEEIPKYLGTSPRQQSNKQFKNSQNYHEWRKVSMDDSEQKKISYNLSSYEHESERLENIRSKNEMSLKKYIEGKSYLSKLIKYRNCQL